MQNIGLIFFGVAIVLVAFIFAVVKLYIIEKELIVKILQYVLIFSFVIGFTIAAVSIGFKIHERNATSQRSSYNAVREIWGGEIVQELPIFSKNAIEIEQYLDEKSNEYKEREKKVYNSQGFENQNLNIIVDKNIRNKGELLFPGYSLTFKGSYQIKSNSKKKDTFYFYFPLPDYAGNIKEISVLLNGKPYEEDLNLADGISWSGTLDPNEEYNFTISYIAQGTGRFSYNLGSVNTEIKNLNVSLTTDFENAIIANGAMVPSDEKPGKQSLFVWNSNRMVSGQSISLLFTINQNYGTLVSKMYFYSPLTLFLFTLFLLVIIVGKKIKLHPMHYLFVLTAFFIFYLVFSYSISYMHILLALFLSALISTSMVGYYVYTIKAIRPLLLPILAGLVIFQWIFSFAFFFPAHTGIIVTAAAIVSFLILMRATIHVNWHDKW